VTRRCASGLDGSAAESSEHSDAPERIEWLELFFDLVVVAAVAVMSDALREDATWGGLGIFAVTYGAVWFAWVSVVMYADVGRWVGSFSTLSATQRSSGSESSAHRGGGRLPNPPLQRGICHLLAVATPKKCQLPR
jgi:hypothetical protein